jgi:amino acid transporter
VSSHNITDHTAVSVFVMYLIAGTFVVCDAIVLLAKGMDALPFGVIGLIGSLCFIVAALAMAQYVKRQAEH